MAAQNKSNLRHDEGLSLGTWLFGGKGWQAKLTQSEVSDLVHTAVDGGIRVIDTAPIYGMGRAESLLAEPLRRLRDRVTLVTKCGLQWDTRGRVSKNHCEEAILTDIRQSLFRLKVEYVDVLLIHWPDGCTPHEETAAGLHAVVDQGFARQVGLSNWTVENIAQMTELAPIRVLQDVCNLAQPGSSDYRELVNKHRFWTMGYSALAQGLLTGKYTAPPTLPKNDFRNYNPLFFEPQFSQVKTLLSQLREQVLPENISLTHFALKYVQSICECAVVGVRNKQQLKHVLQVHRQKLTPELLQKTNDLIRRCRLRTGLI